MTHFATTSCIFPHPHLAPMPPLNSKGVKIKELYFFQIRHLFCVLLLKLLNPMSPKIQPLWKRVYKFLRFNMDDFKRRSFLWTKRFDSISGNSSHRISR